MSIPADKPVTDARYWAEQVEAVASRRDRECFMRIYDHFAPRLQGYLLGLGVAHAQAEELVQEALLRLWRKASQFDASRASLSTWLFRITRNLYIDSVRREPHWLPVEEGLDRLDTEQGHVEQSQAESYADQVHLQRVIETLPPAQARLVRMSYLEAKSHSQIASELSMPLGSVKSSLRQAFIKIRKRIHESP